MRCSPCQVDNHDHSRNCSACGKGLHALTRRMTSVRCLLATIALATLAACGGHKDPVQALLKELETAAEHRDADAVVRHLAPDFRGSGGLARADVGPLLRRYFAAYEKVNLTVYDVTVERGEASTRVRFRVDFDGRPLQLGGLGGFLPPSAMYRFDLGLRQIEGRLMVTEAAWEEVAPPAPAQASS